MINNEEKKNKYFILLLLSDLSFLLFFFYIFSLYLYLFFFLLLRSLARSFVRSFFFNPLGSCSFFKSLKSENKRMRGKKLIITIVLEQRQASWKSCLGKKSKEYRRERSFRWIPILWNSLSRTKLVSHKRQKQDKKKKKLKYIIRRNMNVWNKWTFHVVRLS
jgi:hypothetical protein